MYLIITNRCTECGDELQASYIKEFGLICPVCIREMAEIIREGELVYERKNACI
jgi:ribosomal protein S14